jgi:hypothetical protein
MAAGGGLYWERGITQMFNPEPTGIETVLYRWLPVFTYVTDRAINDTLELSLSDLNKDGTVNILDITVVATAYGSKSGDPKWNALADLDKNGTINILDIALIAKDYGKTV